MVNTQMRLIIFFAAKDGEALYSQQKQDRGLEVRNRFKGLNLRECLKNYGRSFMALYRRQ